MIDEPKQTERLLARLEASLPLRARTTLALAQALRERAPKQLPRDCVVTEIRYLGDDGGIVCRIGFGSAALPGVYYASITHLAFDSKAALASEIKAYQRRRAAALARPSGAAAADRPHAEGRAANAASVLDRYVRQVADGMARGKMPSPTSAMATALEENPEWVLDSLEGLARRLADDEDKDDSVMLAHLTLLTAQLEFLRFRIDRGYAEAKSLQAAFERRLAALAQSGALSDKGVALIAGAMRDARLRPGADVIAAGDNARAHASAAPPPANPDALLAEVAEAAGGDPFALADGLQKAIQALPAGARAALAESLLVSAIPAAREAAILVVLDPEAAVRRGTAQALLRHAEALSPTALRRLIVLRNWLPADERAPLDQAVRAARTSGIECAAWAPGGVAAVHASAIDGSGAQGLLIVSPAGRRQTLSSILMRDTQGVLDAWVLDAIAKRECSGILGQMTANAPARTVSRDYLDWIVGHHLAVGLERDAVPPIGLLRAAEANAAAQWRPARLAWPDILDELIAQMPAPLQAPDQGEAVVAASAQWAADSGLSDSWFEDDQAVADLVRGARRQQGGALVRRILHDVLEPRRRGWAERFVWTALWLREGSKSDPLWPRFALLAHALLQGRPLDTVPLMHEIAATTVAAMQAERR